MTGYALDIVRKEIRRQLHDWIILGVDDNYCRFFIANNGNAIWIVYCRGENFPISRRRGEAWSRHQQNGS